MVDAPHEQGTIKRHRADREQGPVVEEARFHPFHGQRLHPPVESPQFHAVELAGVGR
jgi:hypothetical protein